MKRKLLSILMALTMSVAVLPAVAIPAEAALTPAKDTVIVGGITLTSGLYLANGSSAPSYSKPASGGYAYFKNHVLTLHDAVVVGNEAIQYCDNETGEIAICSSYSLTIILEGNNFAEGGDSVNVASIGVWAGDYDESLTIQGNGSLTATGGLATEGSTGIGSGGDLIITGNVTVTAIGGTVTGEEGQSWGLFAQTDMTISANAKVTAVGGKANGMSGGVASDGSNIIIDNSTLIARTLSSTGDASALERDPDLINASIAVASRNSSGSSPVAYTEDDFYDYKYIKITVNGADGGFPFIDVPTGYWARNAIGWAYDGGLFSGTSSTTFSPDAKCTRAMLWTVLGRLDGQTLVGPAVFDKARQWAITNSISDGSDPNGNVTREQLTTVLWRYTGAPQIQNDMSGYTDFSSVSYYAREAMRWAVAKGIVSGTSNTTLSPQDTATRAQIATIFMRFSVLMGK